MNNNNTEEKEKIKRNKWLSLVAIPSQMGVTIFLFFKLGQWLDTSYPNSVFYYDKVFTLVGVFLALYNVIKQVNEINK
ncbi:MULTISPECIES: AtpZ/AtpI family protein [Flavobacterium]|uniref:AtpZ/AtpI family protein n=2 Tax=Flavobacterium TaxID=237 RepID=A0AA94JP11_9FLAO|nr:MULTISPECIES: AtpZ/AtpI family protein [Flavobacterium]OXA82642.1 F0F1-ATPase subunit [Flavobacterium columnare] [Flavobacterium columnare NBRC 100251 = ATCC 23463]AMA48026.1 F0F1-ATPase subunit [Flavobacterium covae]AND63830.1 F0F1-ATPase subunit [Flavobacterium covae]MCH4829927.1 AtpZ/AtpI family protein [Flavobacterium columnare]MCH4832692.1 AtpZ/AtpI family protein [Flavobacterium columnare]